MAPNRIKGLRNPGTPSTPLIGYGSFKGQEQVTLVTVSSRLGGRVTDQTGHPDQAPDPSGEGVDENQVAPPSATTSPLSAPDSETAPTDLSEMRQPDQVVSGPTPPTRRRRRWVLVAAAAALAIVVAAGITIFVIVVHANSDSTKIGNLAQDFATAVDTENQPKIVSLLCTEEADAITDSEDYDPSNTNVATPKPKSRPVTVSDIQIRGNVASARISRPHQSAATLYFRKEAGAWKVCAPARTQLSASPSPTR
jgi:hypothetical protein